MVNDKWKKEKSQFKTGHFLSLVFINRCKFVPLIVSSKTAAQSFAVTAVLDSILGLEFISMSHGVKSSVNMKSAP